MISGRQTLDTITKALGEERAKSKDLDRRMAAASDRLVAIDVERGKRLAELARLRVGQIAAGSAGRLAGAEAQVARLLEERDAARRDLSGILDALDARLDRLEARRAELADALEEASERVDVAEAEVQDRLQADEAYRARRERAEAAERTARFADEKARESEAERIKKGRAFEAEPIFMDLWRRGYGTSAYRAGPLTRILDRWAARLVGFDAARANYARLVDLPLRLREHADAVDEAAQEAYLELRRLDEEARAEAGVPRLEEARETARLALEEHDEETAAVAAERATAFQALERHDRGEDERYAQAIAFLSGELGRADVQELRREALATPYPQDDVIVAALLGLEEERERVRASLDELRSVAATHAERARELEELRRRFTQTGMHGPGTTFPDRDLVTTMVTQFLLGALTRDALWRVLERQRRVDPGRSNPTFGSGGFGRGSPWSGGRGWPGAGPSGGGGRSGGGFGGGGFGTGGRIGGGGFRTGGRMGGGGFRTGGKF